MEVQLTPELEALISQKMATGRYQNPEQILVEALRGSVVLDEQRAAALNALRHMFDDGSEESATARSVLREHQDEFRKNQA